LPNSLDGVTVDKQAMVAATNSQNLNPAKFTKLKFAKFKLSENKVLYSIACNGSSRERAKAWHV
jgi:hypothetical protein